MSPQVAGRLFQTRSPAAAKLLLPYVFCVGGRAEPTSRTRATGNSRSGWRSKIPPTYLLESLWFSNEPHNVPYCCTSQYHRGVNLVSPTLLCLPVSVNDLSLSFTVFPNQLVTHLFSSCSFCNLKWAPANTVTNLLSLMGLINDQFCSYCNEERK